MVIPPGAQIESYRDGVKSRIWEYRPEDELIIICRLLDMDGITFKQRKYLWRRWKKVEERCNNPSSRYQAIGVRPGRLGPEDQKKVETFKKLQKYKEDQ